MLCVPRRYPDVDVLDLYQTVCVDGCIISRGDKSFHGLVCFEIFFADLQFGRRRLQVEDGFTGKEAPRGLLVVF
jgi:hypothetical protein